MIVVYGETKGKGRPRFYRGHAVTPEATRKYEEEIRRAYAESNCRQYRYEPLSVSITAFFPIPKSYTRKRKEAIQNGLEQPCKKPDIDNICKAVLDALNGVAYADDKQIVRLSAVKRYGDPARVEIEIKEHKL